MDYSQSAVDLASSVAAEEQVKIKYLVSIFFFFTVKIDLQSHLAKSTMSIDFINELIIRKMNLLVIAAASLNSNLSSGMHNEQWIFWLQLYSIQSDGKIFEWINCFEDANLISNSRKLSCQNFHKYLKCEFTVQDKWIWNLQLLADQTLKNKFVNEIFGGGEVCAWPGLTVSYPSQISRPGFHILLIAKYNIMNLIKER